MKQYIYNTSDIGYMDEEWINYNPRSINHDKIENVQEKLENKNEEQTEEV
jgi:hypothetical protein